MSGLTSLISRFTRGGGAASTRGHRTTPGSAGTAGHGGAGGLEGIARKFLRRAR